MIALILITILIDFIISYFIPVSFNNLNYFYPMLLIVLIVYLYSKITDKKYIKLVFIMGIIYDLLYSYIFMLNAFLFLLFAKIIKKINKYIEINNIVSIILIIIFIFLYDFSLFLIVYLTKYNLVTFSDLLYKFTHSLILNISFYLILSIVLKNVKFKKN